jgi:hypothetical protein
MLKRNTKMISLLVAAVSTMTIVPAMAAESTSNNAVSTTATAASSQCPTKEVFDGTVNNAKVFDAGIFFVDGYKSTDDDTAIYYVTDDGKFNKIDVDGVESGDTFQDFLKGQYIEIIDSKGNATYLDSKNGYKVVDDDIRYTIVDDAANILRSAMKKDDNGRFVSTSYDTSIKAYPKNNTSQSFTTLLSANPASWSHYKYTLKEPFVKGNTYSTIYADQNGNYVDGDYNLGGIKVSTSATTGASVTIKNTKDTYEITDNGVVYDLRAQISEDSSFINEQKDVIRRKATLTIYKKLESEPDSAYTAATNQFYFGDDNNHRHKITSGNSATVIQSFSKEAASDTVDGIKYAKTSDIYFITDKDGNIETVTGPISVNAATQNYSNYYAADNVLHARYLNLAKKDGYNYIDLGDYKETDVNGSSAYQAQNGIFYCLDGDYMKVWNGNDFDKAYKIDGSMDKLNVCNKDNVFVWSDASGVFSIIHNIPKQATQASNVTTATQTTNATTTAQVQVGWVKNADESWCYVKQDGSKAIG